MVIDIIDLNPRKTLFYLLVPVLREISPLTPLAPAFGVLTEKGPLEVNAL